MLRNALKYLQNKLFWGNNNIYKKIRKWWKNFRMIFLIYVGYLKMDIYKSIIINNILLVV